MDFIPSNYLTKSDAQVDEPIGTKYLVQGHKLTI